MRYMSQMAVTRNGDFAAFADSEGSIQVWNMRESRRTAIFESPENFQRSCIAINNDGTICIFGSFDNHGIIGFSVLDSREIWRRSDLKGAASLTTSVNGLRAFCDSIDYPLRSINFATGKERNPLKGVARVIESPFHPLAIQIRFRGRKISANLVDQNNEKLCTMPSECCGKIVFTPDMIIAADKEMSCFDIITKKLRWQLNLYQILNETSLAYHAIDYCEELKHVVLVAWPNSRGGDYRFLRIDPTSGKMHDIITIPPANDYAFCLRGSILVAKHGTIFPAKDVRTTSQLTFFD